MIKVPLCRLQQCLGPFAMFFLKGPLKRDFTDIYLITFFRDGYLGNTSAMSVIFFLKMFKIQCRFQKCTEKLGKRISFLI